MNEYSIKLFSGSHESVDKLVVWELKEYPTKDYGTLVLEVDNGEHNKTVRIVRFKTKELCDNTQIAYVEDRYPFVSEFDL
tara:strand:- start:213 stop:452 length:240 start_codon:yes stop_codon:yes gene_type:complete